MNSLKKKEKEERNTRKISIVDQSDERKYMSDREMLEKYVDLEKSCLTDKEKNQVMDMLYNLKKHSV